MNKIVSRTIQTINLLVLLLLLPLVLIAQNPEKPIKKYSPEEINEDLEILKDNLFHVHPGLDTYYPLDSLRQALSVIEKQIDESISSIELYRLLCPLHKYIANGHTEFIASKSYLKAIGRSSETPRFPFDVYWDGERLYVLRNLSKNETVAEGVEILSINNQPAKEIINFFVAMHTKDGFNESRPELNVYRSFRSYYAFLIGLPDEFEIKLKQKDGTIISKTIKGIPLAEITERRKVKYPDYKSSVYQGEIPAFEFKLAEDYGLMTLRNFGLELIKQSGVADYKLFFANAFEQIKENETGNLVIDLRGNSGGNDDAPIELLTYLLTDTFDFYKHSEINVNKVPNAKYYEGVNWFTNFLVKRLVEKSGDKYIEKDFKDRLSIPVKGYNYNGKIFVLIDGDSFSATGELAGMLKSHTSAVFVGVETGGNPVQNTSGSTIPLVLPNTGVRLNMPFVLYQTNVDFKNSGHGIIPDFPIKKTINDIIIGKDSQLDFVTKELIK